MKEKESKKKNNLKIPKRINKIFDAYFANIPWKKNGYLWCPACGEFLKGYTCPICHKEYSSTNGFVSILDEDYELCTYCIVFFEERTVYVLRKFIYLYEDETQNEDIKYEGIYKFKENALYDSASNQMIIDKKGELATSDYTLLYSLFTPIDYIDEESIKQFGSILEKDVTYLNQMNHLSVITLLYSPFYYKDFKKYYEKGLKKLAYMPKYKIENGKLIIQTCEINKRYMSFFVEHDLGVEEIETFYFYKIKDLEFISILQYAKRDIEQYIYERSYKETPYEKGVPIEVAKKVRKDVIEPFFSTLDFKVIYKYFKKYQIPTEKMIPYLKYRYLLYTYYDFIKKLYYDSKSFPYFYLKCLSEYWDTKENLYISYKKYPENFIHVENTLRNVPMFEYEELFCKENDLLEHLYDLEQDGIIFSSILKQNLFIQSGYVAVENIEALESYLNMTIVRKDEYSLYNLYDYIYDQPIMDFLEENHYYFHNCTLEAIEEFYKKTNLKLKYSVHDKYRMFTFDRYGITGTGGFGEQTYITGEYLKDALDNWDLYQKMEEDRDIRIVIEVEHIDYDEEGIYYQNRYDKWDPLYEDAMEEEEKEEFTNEESQKIYLFRSVDE